MSRQEWIEKRHPRYEALTLAPALPSRPERRTGGAVFTFWRIAGGLKPTLRICQPPRRTNQRFGLISLGLERSQSETTAQGIGETSGTGFELRTDGRPVTLRFALRAAVGLLGVFIWGRLIAAAHTVHGTYSCIRDGPEYQSATIYR